MKKFKAALTDRSLFRRSYIICLFMCNVTPVLVFAYMAVAVMFIWGVFLLIYSEITKKTALRTRYGFWLILFMMSSAVTAAVHFSSTPLYDLHNLIMMIHAAICFFILYGVHTEEQLNFRRELYAVCRFIVYTTTVMGIVGLACLVADIKFEILGLRFIVFENRFTGLYVNPNQLGFCAVSAIFSSHALTKKDFISISGHERVSSIWLASCAAVNALSLMLSDSNGALAFIMGYVIFYLIYKMLGSERKFSRRQIITKSASAVLAGVVIVGSVFFVRNVMQDGFSHIMSESEAIFVIDGKNIDIEEEGIITFEHENANIDSGRFKLWSQAWEMIKQNPVLGVGKGNIYEYGNRLFKNGVKFSKKYGLLAPLMTDFHNGYLTVIVCAGFVGFLLFAVFGLKLFKHVTVRVFTEEGLKESALPCMFAFLCSYAVYAFIEEALLFNLMFTVAFFWLILGYTTCFLVGFEPDESLGTVKLFGREIKRSFL